MGDERWKRYALVAGWGAVLSIFAGGALFTIQSAIGRPSDFTIYLAAANALRHNPHATIYSVATLASTHATYGGCAPLPNSGYLYQPLLALALQPLTLVPCDAATAIWLAFNSSLMLACAIWLARWMGRRHGAGAALATAALCVLSVPLYYGLYYGQAHLLILGACLAAVSLMRRGHPRWAGAVLAVGAFIKYLPALLLVYYLARRQWAAGIGAAITSIALALVELALVGPATLRASIFDISGGLRAGIPQSMTATLPYEPYIVAGLTLGVCLVIYLVLFRWGRADNPAALGMSVGEAWAIGAMLFASPMVWYFYLTWLLPVVVALSSAALTIPGRRLRWLSLSALAALFALTFVAFLASLALTVAALALWLLSALLLLRQSGVLSLSIRRSRMRLAALPK